jgi:hypothetical protein
LATGVRLTVVGAKTARTSFETLVRSPTAPPASWQICHRSGWEDVTGELPALHCAELASKIDEKVETGGAVDPLAELLEDPDVDP